MLETAVSPCAKRHGEHHAHVVTARPERNTFHMVQYSRIGAAHAVPAATGLVWPATVSLPCCGAAVSTCAQASMAGSSAASQETRSWNIALEISCTCPVSAHLPACPIHLSTAGNSYKVLQARLADLRVQTLMA